jgi:hypothetical protein
MLPAIWTDLRSMGCRLDSPKPPNRFPQTRRRGLSICKKLEVIGITILLARIHVDQHGHGPIPTCQQGSGPDQQESREKPGPLTL